MGNCQAAEAAAVVIQHPGGKVERLYWPTSAADVMTSNPGHYVALVTLCYSEEQPDGGGRVRLTRVKLLKAKDTLLLGQVYRLITSQEVTKALRARQYEKMKKTESEFIERQQQQRGRPHDDQVKQVGRARQHDLLNNDQGMIQASKQERDRHRSSGTQSAGRVRQWRPSLQSISEQGS
ncbi:uncharacterized protein [Typha angustifolia]|uniref:uncharacterized protein n=1 Tax=Typha angustifolia TaxID=59011 RepID=UPI003C2C40D6